MQIRDEAQTQTIERKGKTHKVMRVRAGDNWF